ncbi:MAG: hypothetical protein ACJA02_000408 [Myxococcota bacterium]|jgi:hypothetical protein
MKKTSIKARKSRKPKKNLIGTILSGFIKSTFLIILISAVYFLALIAIEYKSFLFITAAIEEGANKNLPSNYYINIKKSSLKFSTFHKIKVRLDEVRVINKNKEELLFPKVEAEFSIFNLLLLKTTPSKLIIIAPEIEVSNNSQISFGDVGGQKLLLQKGYSEILSQIFTTLKLGKVAIKNFLITDAKINIKNNEKVATIILKESHITTSFKDGYLQLTLANKISLNPKDLDLLIDANCVFSRDEAIECDTSFRNFIPSSIAFLDPKLSSLSQISGKFSGDTNLIIDKYKHLSSASFDLITNSASFYYPEYFSGPIDLKNLIFSGKLNNKLKTFSINNLHCNFADTGFSMSLLASDFLDKNKQKTIMQFKVTDVPTNNLKLLWPTFLNQNNVRDWFLGHIKNGVVTDGYATMILKHKNGHQNLERIESELAFSGLDLQYNQYFPTLSKVNGIAFFDRNQMQIDISKGDILDSRINFASISIPEFHAKKPMLNIDGKVIGKAGDGLKHINYKSQFAKEIKQYFRGKTQTNLSIKLPINHHLSLKDVYIKIDSDIDNFENEYINNSNLKVSVLKDFGHLDFATKIDLTKTDLNFKRFNVIKRPGVKSSLTTRISFDENNILHLKNLNLQENNKKMSGELSLQTSPIKISQINIENRNFANSNFDLNYKSTNDSSFLRINGKSLDLKSFLESSNSQSGGFNFYHKNDIKISIDKLSLAQNQNLTDLNIDLKCDKSFCEDGIISARYNQDNHIDIEISSPTKKNPTLIAGFIQDVSVLAKGLNISNQILDGRAKIKSKLDKDGKLEGEIRISREFTVLRNEVVEKIYDNDAFGKFKETDLKNNKIKFNNLKLKFGFSNNVLNIKTLITNSHKLGFTSKGTIDFKSGKTDLKGLIVPGYVLNKFFGIGRIPILGRIIVGEEGGGIFAVRYSYIKTRNQLEGEFNINTASAIAPGGIRNIFNLF